MKTQRFASEMEKISGVKMRALETASLAVPGGVIGLAYAKSEGKTRKFDEEDIGGLVAGGVAGAAAALTLSAGGRLGIYRNKLKQFMQSKKVVDGPTQMTNLTMAERPKWIKEQIKAVDAQDWENEYFQAQAKKHGYLKGDTPQHLSRAQRQVEAIRTNTPRRIESVRTYLRPQEKLINEAHADVDAWQSEIEGIGPSPDFIGRTRKGMLAQFIREKERSVNPIKAQVARSKSLLKSLESKGKGLERLSSTQELKKIEQAHQKAINAAKSQTWEDVDKKYFGLLG